MGHGAHGHGRERNVGIAVLLNMGFTVAEFAVGMATNSLALVADSLHDLGDTIVLAIAWLAERVSAKGPDSRMTYGYARLSLLSSLLAGTVLVAGSIVILYNAIPRLMSPEHVKAGWVTLFAVFGVSVNGIAYLKLRSGKSQNEKVLSWHMMEDMLGWAVILVGSAVMAIADIHVIDPLMTIGFTLFILLGVSRSIIETARLLMEGMPSGMSMERIVSTIRSIPGVSGVHDIHVWSLEGETNLLTAHVVFRGTRKDEERIRKAIRKRLEKEGISHATIEMERKECEGCGIGRNNHGVDRGY